MGDRDDTPLGRKVPANLRERAGSEERLRPEPAERKRVSSSRYRLTTPGQIEHVRVPDVTVRRTSEPVAVPPARPQTPTAGTRPAAFASPAPPARQPTAGAEERPAPAPQARSPREGEIPARPRYQAPAPQTGQKTLPPQRVTPPAAPAARPNSQGTAQAARARVTQSLSAATAAAQRVIDRATANQATGPSDRPTPTTPHTRTSAPPERSGVFADRKPRRREDTILGVGLSDKPKDGSHKG